MEKSEDLKSLAGVAEEILKIYSFQVFSPLGDRHGCWEVTFYAPSREASNSKKATCFVILAFTYLSAARESSGQYNVEIWAGADAGGSLRRDDRIFSRELTFKVVVSEDDLGTPQILRDRFAEPLKRAVIAAGKPPEKGRAAAKASTSG